MNQLVQNSFHDEQHRELDIQEEDERRRLIDGDDQSSGMGDPVNFNQVRNRFSQEDVRRIKQNMACDLVFITIIIIFISIYGKDANCGIPIFEWCVVYFVILALKSLT